MIPVTGTSLANEEALETFEKRPYTFAQLTSYVFDATFSQLKRNCPTQMLALMVKYDVT